MKATLLSEKAQAHLHKLCVESRGRRVGSAGNQAATEFVAGVYAALGFETECPAFACLDWVQGGTDLTAGGSTFRALVSPYSLSGRFRGPLVAASRVEDLEAFDLSGRIVLLRGDIAKEQLMPKNFVFYNPDEHKRVIRALESARPLAIVAATGRDPGMAGAVYPFPLIEDGDFDIPSVYVTDVEGERLALYIGEEISLEIRAQRMPSTACNVVARKDTGQGRRAVLFAHVDTKEGTPGALDNAGGVSVLLLLAELLTDFSGTLAIEFVALNGEDYYAAPGEMQWLRANEDRFDDIVLGINLDGVGHRGGRPAYSLYGCPPDLAVAIRQVFAGHPFLAEGQPWYQSDHGLFLMKGIPALAVTSEQFNELWSEVAHTPNDTPEIVEPAQLVNLACALRDLLLCLDQSFILPVARSQGE